MANQDNKNNRRKPDNDKRNGDFIPKVKETRLKVGEPKELMDFLLEKMGGMKRNSIKSLLAHRQILVNGQITTKYNHELKKGDVVAVSSERGTTELFHPKVKIIFEDPYLIVVEKREGILTVKTDNGNELTVFSILKNHVQKSSKTNRIYTVHRLDRETSGVLVFAKNLQVKQALQDYWHTDVKKRIYTAVVEGKMDKKEDTIVSWLTENAKSLKIHSSSVDNGGQQAVTHYKVIKSNDDYSLLQIELETGRKNQIRVHMQSIEHPIVGDKKYGAKTNPIGRVALHARILEFYHPVTRKVVKFETPVPRNFLHLFH
ncbi:RluA family pseudouridine synthase [Paludibacter sp. 221]|uniref:RluA family pseudouridine synthase n=1 Tax=Paludibacter sp. 221 TaxID=2302939 RepID=UPI0013D13C0A|nr:RluA family pseudouridine synthase [Paludibacter sp. 221]NDV46565.1 RluA family pseudouridine synthase [Paludibacter sp. 221]